MLNIRKCIVTATVSGLMLVGAAQVAAAAPMSLVTDGSPVAVQQTSLLTDIIGALLDRSDDYHYRHRHHHHRPPHRWHPAPRRPHYGRPPVGRPSMRPHHRRLSTANDSSPVITLESGASFVLPAEV